jgi:hypothetical protein
MKENLFICGNARMAPGKSRGSSFTTTTLYQNNVNPQTQYPWRPASLESCVIGNLKSTLMITAFGRSRPAADASREVVKHWLLDGLM